MLSVCRFPLRIDNDQIVDLPVGAKILSVQAHRNQVVLWALVDDDEKSTSISLVRRRFVLFTTGMPIPGDWKSGMGHVYLGTVQQEEGTVVWHVFEVV